MSAGPPSLPSSARSSEHQIVNSLTTSPFRFYVFALAIDPRTPSTLYAGTGGGVYQSTDSGGSWSAVLSDQTVVALAIDPSTPSTLYAGTQTGAFAFELGPITGPGAGQTGSN